MRVLRSIAATSTLVLALGGAVLAAPAAQADTAASTATVERYDGAIWYRAAAGQVNDLRISTKMIDVDPDEFGGDYLVTFRDKFEITITSTDVCTYPSATDRTVVECVEPEPLGSDDSDIYDVDLGDLDDTATVGDDVFTEGTLDGDRATTSSGARARTSSRAGTATTTSKASTASGSTAPSVKPATTPSSPAARTTAAAVPGTTSSR